MLSFTVPQDCSMELPGYRMIMLKKRDLRKYWITHAASLLNPTSKTQHEQGKEQADFYISIQSTFRCPPEKQEST
jgi:hypothetical protein